MAFTRCSLVVLALIVMASCEQELGDLGGSESSGEQPRSDQATPPPGDDGELDVGSAAVRDADEPAARVYEDECADGSCASDMSIESEELASTRGKGGGKQRCGDGRCHASESCSTCAADCGECPAPPPDPFCGDGACNGDESCSTCASDCGECPPPPPDPFCGDGACNGSETCSSCASDCGACPPPDPFCGDGTCDADESCSTCASDCGACPPPDPFCGDGTCNGAEDCATCASDCGACPSTDPVCGDSVCDGNSGEMCTNCESDCKTLNAVCGNGECESGESSSSCEGDCGPSPWPNDWATWEAEVVTLINQHRAAGTDCPSGAKNAVGALTMESALQNAARLHSWDQSFSGYFSHTSCNGRSPWTRAADAGTSADGETIGWGYSSPTAMVNGWLSSTSGHCDILMSGNNTVIGVGFATPGSNLWTAMFR